MKTKSTLILASTLLTALFAAQSAVASEATDENFFLATDTSSYVKTDVNRNFIKVSMPASEGSQLSTKSDNNFFPEGQGQ